jgi:tetratricopeptide (TPR) repeat protein
MFVEKARRSFDPGYYKLAEACAECLDSRRPGSAEAQLIRGHALNSLHRFSEAETVARQLVSMRGLHLDYALLGDSLMEQGKLGDAIQAYQQMIDLKPGPHSYARAAHVRWLKGDLEGAIEMMKKAARSLGPAEGESAAWNYSRLASYELQAGNLKTALLVADAALELQAGYAPALLVRGRVLLASGKNREAVEALRSATSQNPLPEYQWTLAEALRASGELSEARAVESELEQNGATSDPRTFALYLATCGESVDTAVTLTQDELKTRRDVFTLDAAAWALASTGRTGEARDLIRLAVAEGTNDARLFYHAGSIASLDGDRLEAKKWLIRADRLKQMLLPSERSRLKLLLARV